MEDSSGPDIANAASLAVGLDFANPDREAEITALLEFAEFEISEYPDAAGVVLGDGSRANDYPLYIHLQDESAPAFGPVASVAQPRLSSLYGAFARARSAYWDHQQFAQSNPVFCSYVGVSDAAVRARRHMATAAAADVTVLITGESGTGKDVIAKALHNGSDRAQGPFVPVNCGAIPAELLESELFGHERGAFTGAVTRKTGRFELAHSGTLFLDEIGDMPHAMQVKMLRAIEHKNFERVGGTQTCVSDARIVAATNIDLESKINTGEFREDLYYRLNVFPIELAPLRDRIEDIPLLVDALIERIQQEQNIHIRLSQDALGKLQEYSWPGNVRELANLLQRLAIQFPHALVTSKDLPAKYHEAVPSGAATVLLDSAAQDASAEPSEILLPVNGIDLKDYLTRLERSLIEQALDDTDAVVARAADRLHIRRTTLVEKMRKHGLGRNVGAVQ